jgi:PAS domain S-box-containing protein
MSSERAAGAPRPNDLLEIVQEKYRNIFYNIQDVYYEIALDGRILEVSPSCRQISRYNRNDLIGRSMSDIYAEAGKRDAFLKQIRNKGRVNDYEILLRDKDGTLVPCAISARLIKFKTGVSPRIVGIMRDISERKRAEEDLRHSRDELECRVKERTEDLEKTNAALKVLLKHREADRVEHEELILTNVGELVLPYLHKLKRMRLTEKQAAYVHVIETNLNQIVSPFLKRLTSKHLNLTPRELQIADFIKGGKTTKDISELLGVSVKTVDYHRDHIRDKLGLKRRKANLRSYLLSMM